MLQTAVSKSPVHPREVIGVRALVVTNRLGGSWRIRLCTDVIIDVLIEAMFGIGAAMLKNVEVAIVVITPKVGIKVTHGVDSFPDVMIGDMSRTAGGVSKGGLTSTITALELWLSW